MKITELSIRRCGVWRDVSLPLSESGLSVLYGPNEAGKSTLMRFVRGVLFGSNPCPQRPGVRGTPPPPSWEGSLRVEQGGRRWEVRRSCDGPAATTAGGSTGPRGRLTVVPLGDGTAVRADEWLAEALGGTTEEVYEKVFAVGLMELQELATLSGEQVARQIYGASLGPDGERLLSAFHSLDDGREKLVGGPGDGSLRRLVERRSAVQRDLEGLASLRGRYDALRIERGELAAEIERLESRAAELQRQVRAHYLVEKAYGPWQEVDALRRERASLPDVTTFPEGGVERLRALDAEIAQVREQRDRLRAGVAECRRRAGDFVLDDELAPHSQKLQSLIDNRAWIHDAGGRLAEAQVRERRLRQELDAALERLGQTPAARLRGPSRGESSKPAPPLPVRPVEAPAARLDAFSASPAGHVRLVAAGRCYQHAVDQRNRLRRRLKRWSRDCRVQAAEAADRLKSLGIEKVGPALVERRQRLDDLNGLARLHTEERRLREREQELRCELNRLGTRLAYPGWLPALLWFFTIAGAFAVFLGYRQGLGENAVAGLMWLLLGATCGGLAWAVKSHYDAAVSGTTARLKSQLGSLEGESRRVEQEIAAVHRRATWLRDEPAAVAPRIQDESPLAKVLERTEAETAELERLAAAQSKIAGRRERLSRTRQRFQALHRDVTSSRQEWIESLRQCGLPETRRVSEAFAEWEALVEAHQRWRAWQEASARLEETRALVEPWEQEVTELGRRLPGSKSDRAANEVLSGWETRLASFAQTRDERSRLVREGRRQHREAVRLAARLRKLRAERRALLCEGGAASRREFKSRFAALTRRAELAELLELAEAELNAVMEGETELALVDEDFRSYRADTHRQRQAACRAESAEAERAVRDAHARLGSVRQELKGLEEDRREMSLRAASARIDADLAAGLEAWCALFLAGQTLDALRSRYERTCQPATLAAASGWMQRLTRERYRSVWAPLGQRDLKVEDARGRSFSVEELSSGTREQLFLAVRLALVRQLRDKGVDVPMVLDDVLVNFDQNRTEAALDTLAAFASEGQQVLLFTCHLHLARLAESRQIAPVWLPAHTAEEERKAG